MIPINALSLIFLLGILAYRTLFLCISEQAAPLSTGDLILCLLIMIIQEIELPVKLIEKIVIASLSLPATASSFTAVDFLGVAPDSDTLREHDLSDRNPSI